MIIIILSYNPHQNDVIIIIITRLHLVPVLDGLRQSDPELTVALEDLGNPATSDRSQMVIVINLMLMLMVMVTMRMAAPVEHCLDLGLW